MTTGLCDPSPTPNTVILPHRSPDSGSFVILSQPLWQLTICVELSETFTMSVTSVVC